MTADSATPPTLSTAGSIKLRAAFTVSSTGDWIYKFAVPTLILHLTGSAPATAFAYVLEFIPYVVVGPFAGVLADRFSRRGTMVACDSVSCVLALVIAGLVMLGHPPLAALYGCALALGCTRPVYFPAFQGFLVEMVSEDKRPRFNSWTEMTDGLLSLAGPVLGISVVATAGVPRATVLDAISFAVSAGLVATIAYRRLPSPRADVRAPDGDAGLVAGVLRELAAGLRMVASSRVILTGTILLTLANLAAYIIEGNLVFLLLHVQHDAKIVLGLVFGVQGLGAVAGAFAAPRLLARFQTGLLLTAGLGVAAAAMVLQAIAPVLPVIAVGQGLQGAGSALIVVCWFSSVQRLIPHTMIGRFVSVVRAIGYATLPAGALLGAWLLTADAAARTLFACAATLQLLILLVTARSALRRIDAEEPLLVTAQPAEAV
ncbi:MAG TPA: MFS transporter [Streptosporangiaceae bacterium]|nr:MFS transporter [Streptosporangiaceae bacterium]